MAVGEPTLPGATELYPEVRHTVVEGCRLTAVSSDNYRELRGD
jgi:hypothetical protein